MKKFLMALVATTMIAGPIATTQAQAAPPQHRTVVKETVRGPHGRTVVKKTVRGPHGRTVVKKTVVRKNNHNYRRWAKGQRFDPRYAANYRVIGNPRAYRLNAAPRGYHWVQSGNDAVLVAIAGGLIGAVVAGALN